MKAIRIQEYGGPEQLRYEEAPIPEVKPNEVLIRIYAAGVNPVDYKTASGAMKQYFSINLPWTPGNDFSGVIEKTGANVTKWKQGDEVYGDCSRGGAYAQFAVTQPEAIALKPRKLTHTEAASVPVGVQTAWQALFDNGNLKADQTVLIHAAAGGVGSFAVQLAHWKGARVVATCSQSHAQYVKSLGADQVIDYHAIPFETVVKNVDLVLDLVGGDTQIRSFGVVKAGGYLISTVQPPSQEEAEKHHINAKMIGMKPSPQILKQLADLLDAGTIKTVVSKTYPLSQAQDAWKDILSKHTQGKIVLQVMG